MYIATSSEINMDPYVDNAPRNWIPPRKRKTLQQHSEDQRHDESRGQHQPQHTNMVKDKAKELCGKETTSRRSDESKSRETLRSNSEDMPPHRLCDESTSRDVQTECKRYLDKSKDQQAGSWEEIHEVIESDFLISPGDIYPSRKVELQDADVSEETLHKFELLCEEQQEAFSKNNQDIGKTQLIEMEIDTGGSVPLAQSPYTLPLKHYDWVRKEIETLEKAGVIERSLSPWASPVIVVPKKSAPDEPPRR